MADFDAIVIGAGLMGAASAWSLARRGRAVLVVEQFAAGHDRGGSHGSARIVRRAYGDALYTRLAGRAFELWRELEADGPPVLRMLGGLDFGPRRDVASVAAHLADAGVAHELLAAEEAAARWPGMRFDGAVVFHPQAGVLDAALAVEVFLATATGLGAVARHSYPVESVSVDDGATVTFADGSVATAPLVVVAAGGWAVELLAGLAPLPPLRVTEQTVLHFPRRDPSAPAWPTAIHDAKRAVYHLAGGRDGGPDDDRKIGVHDPGTLTTARDRSGRPDPDVRAELVDYVREWLPGLEPEPSSATTCLYTLTPSEDFLLDRVGPVVVCSPCSGHGAKFAPLIGELVADLAEGRGSEVPDRFRLAAHAAGVAGAVSL